jgi:F-type H+-transporting ATPase subunit epsilon
MADNKIRLRIVTPVKQMYDNEVDMVIMRAGTGEMGVLHGHQPLTTTLGYGILHIKNDNKELKATLFGGFADVQPDCVTILSDAAEWPDEIDTERAEAAKQRAEKRIKSNDSNIDTMRAELALRRALLRLDVNKISE